MRAKVLDFGEVKDRGGGGRVKGVVVGGSGLGAGLGAFDSDPDEESRSRGAAEGIALCSRLLALLLPGAGPVSAPLRAEDGGGRMEILMTVSKFTSFCTMVSAGVASAPGMQMHARIAQMHALKRAFEHAFKRRVVSGLAPAGPGLLY